ncbi:signal peptide peptidase SppA [Pseudoalteromonas sp. SG45-5]|uniref:signal peptide peptidase SppA n=1 Tax=unclassified Pseudoalteromonas TaxID=194690 RepID=UPI0015F7C598|nr:MULTISPECIES: signal peptide peptidase SppA [unclassified Pseudoalteromonas]MBB1387573.1 signal peptide peptidase SppA [Pseudoalteromonas sp. SG45-5]MBB1395799.1 signal peptide peptidase SppA [Pseudoalteromonas sp. SG44-4]MBB1448583.1 signal peptide peptidase SppA [Pseudoalteromonas sp. SG41-6]
MIAKIFKGIWTGINFSRRLVLNILFLLLVIVFIAGITSDEDKITVEDGSVLRLNLNGPIVEEKTYVDPIEAAISDATSGSEAPSEILLDDIVKVINEAAKDERITVLLLDLQEMPKAHLNKLKQIANAIDRFKETGKKVIASGYYYTQAQYYIASHANEVTMHPYGSVAIEGYAMYPLYFKDALEKLEVTQHIFRVGTFKSAVEPFIRNDMSDAAKEANRVWLGALWNQYKQDVAAARSFDESNFDETMDVYLAKMQAANGDAGKYAIDHQWVDSLKTTQQVRKQLIDLVGEDEDGKTFKQVSFRDYLSLVKPPMVFDNPITEKVAVVVARGTIVDGERRAGEIGGDSTAALLRKARLDDKVKAVVLRIDSGGGSMFASEVIRAEVLALKAAGKPVIASMSSVAASGGYWIASAANEIWAAPSTITGSIGVFGTFMTFEKTLSTIGVYSDGVATTEMAGFSITRPLNEKMGQVIQMSVEEAYGRFLNVVADARNMTPEQVDKIAQGRVWIASQALKLGLIDKLGDKQDAIDAAAALAKLNHFEVKTIKQDLSPQQQMMQDVFGNASVKSMLGLQTQKTSVLATQANLQSVISQLSSEVENLKDYNDPQGVYARCLVCTIAQ